MGAQDGLREELLPQDSQAKPVDSSHSKSADGRLYLFNAAIVLCMTLTLLTYFASVPLLPALGAFYGQSSQALIQLSTSYEVGKLLASVAQGHMAKRVSMLSIVMLALAGYTVLVAFIFAMLQAPLLTPCTASYAVFLIAYGVAAGLSLWCQLGLGILRITNKAPTYKRLILVQAILAAVMQGASLLVGGFLSDRFGLAAPFAALGCFSLFMGALLWVAMTPSIRQQCRNVAAEADASGGSFIRDAWQLLAGHDQRQFQAFAAALSTATATMYLAPTVFGLLAARQLRMSTGAVAYLLAAPFGVAVLVRIACLALGDRVAQSTLVRAGLVAQLMSCAAFLAADSVVELSWQGLLGFGFGLQLGSGLVMPNCKSGAMLLVPDHLVSTAASLLKLAQLLVVLVSALAASALYNDSATPFTIFLLCITCCSLLWLLYNSRSSARYKTCIDSPPVAKELPPICAARLSFGPAFAVDSVAISVNSVTDLVHDSAALAVLVENFNKYGIALLRCKDTHPDDILSFGQLFGTATPHLKADDHNRVRIDNRSPTSINVAAAASPHLMHTDEAYSDMQSNILTLMCQQHAPSGGESTLVSAVELWQYLQTHCSTDELRALFQTDTITVGRTLPGTTVQQQANLSVFSIVSTGHGKALFMKFRSKDAYILNVAPAARRAWELADGYVNDPRNQLKHQLQPGEILIIDNRACLHGRLPYSPQEHRIMWRLNFLHGGTLAQQLRVGVPIDQLKCVPPT